MTSRYVFTWDDTKKSWELGQNDRSVSDKFNEWAAKNNVNPVSFHIDVSQHRSPDDQTLTVIHMLAATVIDRERQMQIEMAYRYQIAILMEALQQKQAAPDSSPAAAPASPPISAGAAGASVPAVPPDLATPAVPLTPVNVHDLGETPEQLKMAEAPSHPARPEVP